MVRKDLNVRVHYCYKEVNLYHIGTFNINKINICALKPL